MCLLAICIFSGKMSIQVFWPFFNWVVCFWCWVIWAVYLFWILTLISHIICKYFLPFSRLSFILLMVSFTVQKLLSLIRSHLFTFAFISITLGDRSKKILLQFMSKSVLPMSSSRRFMVLGLTFRSLIHFEFNLCMVLESVLISFFYM